MDADEDGVVFWEDAEVFGSVVAGELVFGGLVESDTDVSVGLTELDPFEVLIDGADLG